MKFLVDAQLPARFARFLDDAGHEALHTTELADGNRTSDARIAELADTQDRVVVTKDRDFRGGLVAAAFGLRAPPILAGIGLAACALVVLSLPRRALEAAAGPGADPGLSDSTDPATEEEDR